jgi:GNAT superfamily N-acetyltransferase
MCAARPPGKVRVVGRAAHDVAMIDSSASIQVRRAIAADAEELTRLRVQMFVDIGRDPALMDSGWQRRNVEYFRNRLAAVDEFAAFVVDADGGGLAAVAVGWLNHHLIGMRNPLGRVAYIANICTDPAYRRRGLSRATVTALLDWLRSTGISTVDLHTTPDGEHLYRSLGFTEPEDRALTLRFGPDPVQRSAR